ncbi:MAG: FKBP-type peptidyl-prolyl cis-trans isomerase [Reichenbachiella sp.]
MKMSVWNNVVFGFFAILSLSCVEEPAREPLILLEDYLVSENLTDIDRTDSGLYYVIDELGDGGVIGEDSIVISHVKITSLNGTIYFDSRFGNAWHYVISDQDFLLEGLLEGIPLIQMGGIITLYMPSELAYGEFGVAQAGIRANEDLIFEVEHVRFKQSIEHFIAENQFENVQMTASGLYYIILTEGEGEHPVSGDGVEVDYTGSFFDGTQFDSSHDSGRTPFSFTIGLGAVIDGWEEGIPLFKKGGAGILLIPYDMAYGTSGRLDQNTGTYAIPPYEHLKFDIELLDIESQ